jgi:outer membrane protein assembly factor BamA
MDVWLSLLKSIDISMNYSYTKWYYNSDFMDNNYSFISGNMSYNLNEYMQLKSGININNYSTIYAQKDYYAGFYANLKYEYSSDLRMYLGYQTQQNRIEDDFENISEGAYFKISAEI